MGFSCIVDVYRSDTSWIKTASVSDGTSRMSHGPEDLPDTRILKLECASPAWNKYGKSPKRSRTGRILRV